MSWFFNADYESFLFSGKREYSFNSSKFNQEFEFFIHFLEKEPIFTSRKYSHDYISKIESVSGRKFLTDENTKNALPWCCPVKDRELDSKLHSKITSTKFALEQGFVKEARLVDLENFKPKENHVYKMEGEISGQGHLLWPKSRAKILSLLEEGKVLIEEPIRERIKDFSALFLAPGKKVLYENLVDRQFQYKGTLLRTPELSPKQMSFYEDALSAVEKHYLKLGISFPFSVDSYLYREDGQEKLNPLSEVNARKTMGYCALKLKEFFRTKEGAILLLRAGTQAPRTEKAIVLSPANNRFQTVFVKANSLEELKNSVSKLSNLGCLAG